MNAQSPSTALAVTTEGAHPAVASLSTGAVMAIVPQTFDEVFRFSQVLARSGLCPYGMDTPEKVSVAILTGLEIGVKPMQAVQGIAVIGGRPCIWGDLSLGIVRASGLLESFVETYEGESPEDWSAARPSGTALKFKAVCRVKRQGQPEAVGEFSIEDAVVGKLWGKRGHNGKDTPWITNPKRMLKMRARAFALRDTFADVLKGMHLAEEMIGTDDDPGPGRAAGPSLPPPPPPLSTAALPKPQEPAAREVTAPPANEAVQDAEIVQADEAHVPDETVEEPFDTDAMFAEMEAHLSSATTTPDIDDIASLYTEELDVENGKLSRSEIERAHHLLDKARDRLESGASGPLPAEPITEKAADGLLPAAPAKDPFAIPATFKGGGHYQIFIRDACAAAKPGDRERLLACWNDTKEQRDALYQSEQLAKVDVEGLKAEVGAALDRITPAEDGFPGNDAITSDADQPAAGNPVAEYEDRFADALTGAGSSAELTRFWMKTVDDRDQCGASDDIRNDWKRRYTARKGALQAKEA